MSIERYMLNSSVCWSLVWFVWALCLFSVVMTICVKTCTCGGIWMSRDGFLLRWLRVSIEWVFLADNSLYLFIATLKYCCPSNLSSVNFLYSITWFCLRNYWMLTAPGVLILGFLVWWMLAWGLLGISIDMSYAHSHK